MKKTKLTKKKPVSPTRVRGVSRKLMSKDTQKKALCVFGAFDGKRITFNDDMETFWHPGIASKPREGHPHGTFDNPIHYKSSTYKILGKLFRVFHPFDRTKDEVLQRLIDNYMGVKQKKELKKKYFVPAHEIEKRL